MKPWLIILSFFCFISVSASEKARAVVPIGTSIPEISFKDIRYLERNLSDLGPAKAYVLMFVSRDCPLAQKYLAKLNLISAKYQPLGVQFAALNSDPGDSIQDVALQGVELEIQFPMLKDDSGSCAKILGVTRTPEVVVLDQNRILKYRGRVDDEHRVGGNRPSASRQDLIMAIQEVLEGKSVSVSETSVDGCAINFSQTPAGKKLTYAKDVAPLLERHCLDCHQPGGEAPFALASYEQVAAKAKMIAEVVSDQRMPPWFAHSDFGAFENERRLNPSEINTIRSWALGDRAQGRIKKQKEAKVGPSWEIGTPDLVVTATSPEKIPATGYIDYRYVLLPHVFEHDTWVQGVEIKPGNRRVVHHAIVSFLRPNEKEGPEKTILNGKVPGGQPMILKNGVGKMIPKGAQLFLEIHYVTTGKPEEDQISVGLKFAKETIRKEMKFKVIEDKDLLIERGAMSHRSSASRELECNATPLELLCHMHLRGKDSTFWAHLPEGRSERLLVVPNYNFDWQLTYKWIRPPSLPKGTRLEMVSHFDNSKFNPYNPDASIPVKHGRQTIEEMMAGWFFYIDNDQDLNIQVDEKTGREIALKKK